MSLKLFDQALQEEGVTGRLAEVARSIYTQESGAGRNTATSNQGAVGGMQIIPGTFKQVADKDWDITNPLQNARAGIRYLKQLDKQAGGDPALTAAGYYGGPGGLEKARRGVAVSDPKNPQAPNTLQYAQQVVGRIPGAAGAATRMASVAPVGRRADGSVEHLAPTPAPREEVVALAQPGPAPVIPAEVVAQGPVNPAPDAWQTFLQTLPAQRPQGGGGVMPRDLDYGPSPQYAQAQIQAPAGQVNMNPAGTGAQPRAGGRLAAMKNFIDMAEWGHMLA